MGRLTGIEGFGKLRGVMLCMDFALALRIAALTKAIPMSILVLAREIAP